MKEYTLGFIFNETLNKVILIKKTKPEWQLGKLNGVGGKVEKGETPEQGMTREIKEETGINIQTTDLIKIGEMNDTINNHHIVHIYTGKTKQTPHSVEYETKGEIVYIHDMSEGYPLNSLSSIPKLIEMGREVLLNPQKKIFMNLNYSNVL